MKLNQEKLPIIYEAMAKNDADAWVIVGRETIMKSEPVLPVLGDMSFIIATTLVFTRDRCIAVVSPLDVEAYKTIDGVDEVWEYPGTMEDTVFEVLSRLKPRRLALDICSGNVPQTSAGP